MKNLIIKSILATATLTLIVAAPNANAQLAYSSGHGDLGVGYDAGAFEPHWHLHSGAVVNGVPLGADGEYAPSELVARGKAVRNSPGGLSSAINVADGSEIYVLGSASYQPNLGFGAEELDPGDWSGDITLTLSGWTLPSGAEFALYTTNLAVTHVADIVFSTSDSGSTVFGNAFDMTPGDHTHFQWGFTEIGIYTFEITWTGTHNTDGFISTTESFNIQIVPEPSIAALLFAGAVGLFVTRRRCA
ncbi:MAG: choice-of-anchor M domain-containing protein [Chthoniobacterales bacterium]